MYVYIMFSTVLGTADRVYKVDMVFALLIITVDQTRQASKQHYKGMTKLM